MVAMVADGLGRGQTAFERHKNLIRLLHVLGRTAEARDAIQALEDAARDRTWRHRPSCSPLCSERKLNRHVC